MSREKLLEKLKMKAVEPKHGEQFNDLLRYVFNITRHDLQSVGWEEGEIAQAKLPVLEQADVLGWFNGDQLVSQLAVYPFQVNIFGKAYEMGGLTGVGTYPEYSNLGLMNKLMRQALANMRERNQSISYLYPFSIPYYRSKGWEFISDKISFQLKDTQLPKLRHVPGNIERVTIQHPDIKRVYDRFARQTHGAMLRSELAWEEYLRWDLEDMTAGIYYDSRNEPTGYLLYWIEEEVFHLKEMIFINQEARDGLWNFISAHFSMITSVKGYTYTDEPLSFLLDDGEIKETIAPYYMARIVDIHLFVKQYPFQSQESDIRLTLALHDPMLEWNQGTFTLTVNRQGEGQLGKGGGTPEAELDIQTFTTMLMGYKRPTYLQRIGRLHAEESSVHLLERLIQRQEPYFSDYF
ncbi:enhanced intracellular survival protein Eis [Paenibacillus hodogayensis]|uniref:Enhanced intracellular survival protein Eis n=1 Tax=Paenibacillus hodogayensis TaxID=279208 RepID=A0ABV5VP05_9BACL